MQKLIKREGSLWERFVKKLADACLKIVGYTTTNPGDSHRPGRTTEITND